MIKDFDIELKNKIVFEYFNNKDCIRLLAKKYSISYNTIQNWIDKK